MLVCPNRQASRDKTYPLFHPSSLLVMWGSVGLVEHNAVGEPGKRLGNAITRIGTDGQDGGVVGVQVLCDLVEDLLDLRYLELGVDLHVLFVCQHEDREALHLVVCDDLQQGFLALDQAVRVA